MTTLTKDMPGYHRGYEDGLRARDVSAWALDMRRMSVANRLRSIGDGDVSYTRIADAVVPDCDDTYVSFETVRNTLVELLDGSAGRDPSDMCDEELAGIGLLRLPADRDGEVIRVGDEMLDGHRERFEVKTISYCGIGWFVDDGRTTRRERDVVHYRASALDNVLLELVDECLESAGGDDEACGLDRGDLVSKFSARIRELIDR